MTTPVVFDCDGVLVDSEALAWDAWRAVLTRYGTAPSDADIDVLTGRTEADAYDHFARRVALPRPRPFSEELAIAISRRFAASLEAFEDVEDTLEALVDRDVPLAVASSSSRWRLALSLSSTGLDRYFQVVVAGDEVDAGKPEPDVFLEAARRLGFSPEDCVAVEDSAAGVTAAKRAGMFVVAVQRGGSADLAAADRVVPRLTPASVVLE
ncbi:MAG: HAD-IA family hydrolase [Gammaproteobacteria bacterium]|nr:HAD-IA family hydrolase [Gammaproteobacteria bacterium]